MMMIPRDQLDLFATKGVEYLISITFLITLLVFWRLLNRGPSRVPAPAAARAPAGTWFHLPLDRYYHPGHAWAVPAAGGTIRLGVDDFAQALLGRPDAIDLPGLGSRVEQGAELAGMSFDGTRIPIHSPVDGTVVACNEVARSTPQIVNDSPYADGWLVEVQPTRSQPNLRTLLHGSVAAAWMHSTEESLRRRLETAVGPVLQDGGIPISGIAKIVAGPEWPALARSYLSNE